jgi:hypothetical protein
VIKVEVKFSHFMLGHCFVFDPCNQLNDPIIFLFSFGVVVFPYEVDVSGGLNVRISLFPKDEFAVRPNPPDDQRKGCSPGLRGLKVVTNQFGYVNRRHCSHSAGLLEADDRSAWLLGFGRAETKLHDEQKCDSG